MFGSSGYLLARAAKRGGYMWDTFGRRSARTHRLWDVGVGGKKSRVKGDPRLSAGGVCVGGKHGVF